MKTPKPKKEKPVPIDGISEKDIAKLRAAIRKVWMWSYPRRLAKNRCLNKNGFFVCENCDRITPTIHIDHIIPVGDLDEGYFLRLYCPSNQLQALCKKCHNAKTKMERLQLK